MTATKPSLPDYNGERVDAAQIKFTGLGTGFNGIDVDPIYMDLHGVGYFVLKATAKESPSVKDDSHGGLVWLNRLSVESMAPIDQQAAERVLAEYAERIQKRRDELEGQMRFDEEQAAADREKADEIDSPAKIAKSAADRLKTSPFVAPPAGE